MILKIALISYEYPSDIGKGGIGTYTYQLAKLLRGRGGEIHVFTASNKVAKCLFKDGIFLHKIHCNSPHDFRVKVMPVFSNVHKNNMFDIIESAEIHANALEIKKAFPFIPLVVRLHAPDYLVESLKKRYVPFTNKLRYVLGALRRGYWDAGYWRKYKPEEDLDYQFCCMANAVTAPSSAMKEWAVKNWKLSPNIISVISNPFQPDDALLNLPLPKGYDYKTIIFFGRLNVLKGLVNATKALKRILAKHSDWKFKVIGDDGAGPVPGGISMRAWMKKQLHGFEKRVFFHDGVSYEKLPEMLKEGEIVILPSLFESFSYTCLEAMAAGKAVVGSKHGGMNDLIENGETGLLIDPERPDDLFQAINFLIEHPDKSFEIATKARIKVSDINRNDVVLRQTLNLYQSLLHEKNQSISFP